MWKRGPAIKSTRNTRYPSGPLATPHEAQRWSSSDTPQPGQKAVLVPSVGACARAARVFSTRER